MISLLKHLFIDNWLRKLISLTLAIILWFLVNQSLTATKTIHSVGVRIINVPEGKTIYGLQSSSHLNKRVSLTLVGKKSAIEDLNANDIEIVLDASSAPGPEWITAIDKKNISSLNPSLSVSHDISRIIPPPQLVIKLVPLSTEKIPIYITPPIGEAPKGFQFLDVWPYHLHVTVSGPEDTIKKLKARGLKHTFNLSNISATDLELNHSNKNKDVVTYYVPDDWKLINLPSISDKPLKIDDADAKLLRLSFVRSNVIPIKFPIPINLYFSPDFTAPAPPASIYIPNNEIVQTLKGIKILNKPLYTKGVNETFVKTIEDMVSVSINVTGNQTKSLDWSLQIINPKVLEDRYVSTMMTEFIDEELQDMSPRMRQEYLRNRFRNYMNRFTLFTSDDKPLNLSIAFKGKELIIKEGEEKHE